MCKCDWCGEFVEKGEIIYEVVTSSSILLHDECVHDMSVSDLADLLSLNTRDLLQILDADRTCYDPMDYVEQYTREELAL